QLYSVYLSICVGDVEAGGLREHPIGANSQGNCDDTHCWSLCHDRYARIPKVTHVGGACESSTYCICEVNCE
ncbi:hypothetical protein BS78_04G110000, partial [Paspalum vaginatum]